MKKKQATGLWMIGRFPQSGVTVYEKQGKRISRSAHNKTKPNHCTLKQFEQRQRMRHSIALWHALSWCNPMFTEHQSAYSGFVALANRLPAVFINDRDASNNASLLMPDIPVSEGTLLSVKQYLGEVDGATALITNMKKSNIRQGMELYLYTAEQKIERDCPKVYFEVRKVTKDEMTETDNGLALVGDDFANTNKGWALVLVKGERCSSQGIVTRCTLYQQYTTPEAMISAAKSHSNRKMKIDLSSNAF
ncbi:MAG: hypothetical protein IKS65_03140 [Bacteroidales bacterium]|nr:hypothetical protein [Bacteroidales bacterium]